MTTDFNSKIKNSGRTLVVIALLLLAAFLVKEALYDKDLFSVLANSMLLVVGILIITKKFQESKIIYRLIGLCYLLLGLSNYFVTGSGLPMTLFYGFIAVFVAFTPEIRAWRMKRTR